MTKFEYLSLAHRKGRKVADGPDPLEGVKLPSTVGAVQVDPRG